MGKSVCFVNLDSINVTPYFHHYESVLEGPYDLIYWNRSENDQTTNAESTFVYNHAVTSGNPVVKLVQLGTGYLGFRSFASKILKKNDYKAVVALTGNCGTILSSVLNGKYKNRFIIDIRDYFLESISLYRSMEEKVIDSAALAIISSPDYVNFLGDHEFQLMHNTQIIKDEDKDIVMKKQRPGSPFVIASIGTAKNLEQDKKVIDYFANDDRFELRFIGRGYDQLKPYCEEKNVKNVFIKGDFKSSETMSFYYDIDAILSMYGSEMMHVRYQLTNKLYYSAQLHLPIIVSPGTTMAKMATKYNMGIALDCDDQALKEDILALYSEDIEKKRVAGMDEFFAEVQSDNEAALEKIKRVINA